MAVKQYQYTTPANYTYDSDKIEVSGGLAKLKEDLSNVYARWHLNEATGATVLDTSGNSRNGTPVNNPVSVVGKLNNCLSFNGTTQYVNCGNIAQYERTQPFSVELWIKYTSTVIKAVIGNLLVTGTGKGWQIYTTGTTLGFQLRGGTTLNAIHMTFTDPLINNGNWHHVVCTYDGSSLASGVTCYIDDVIKTPTILRDALTASIISDQPLTIGQVNGLYMVGSLDETVIYDKKLIQSEVTYKYNSGIGIERQLYYSNISYAHYKLNESTGIDVYDSSIYHRDGITVNMDDSNWVTGKLNNCLQFDGINEYVNLGDIANFERTNIFSVEGWVKLTAKGIIVGREQWISPFRGWYVGISPSGDLQFLLTNTWGTNQLSVYQDTINILDNTWHHFIITYDGSSSNIGVKFYIDGTLRTTQGNPSTLTATIKNSKNCQINGADGSNELATGLIDEVVIYDKKLIQSDVTYRYNLGIGRESLEAYPTIEPTDLFDPALILSWDSFLETLGGENEGSIAYNLYKVDKVNKYYWNGSEWVIGGDSDHYNSQAVVNTNISAFDTSPDKIGFIAYLISDGDQKVELDENQITYTFNQSPLVNAGSNKSCKDNQSITPFSDCSFSDPDGTIDHVYYKVDGEIDTWSEISQGGYGTLLEAVQAWTYQFTNPGTKIVRLQVEDNEGAKSEDSLEVTVSKYTVTFNVKDAEGNHVSDFYFVCHLDSLMPMLKSSPFTYDYDYKATPYETIFFKTDYITAFVEVVSTDHIENVLLTKQIYEETSRIYHPIRIDVRNKKSIIKTLVRGDTILFECKVAVDITDWKIRAELWDDVSGGVDIKKATLSSGGSDFEIEITDATGGVFIVKINKGETTDITDQANLEIELETNEGKIYTVYQSILKFTSEKIKWETP